jgi:hypothetical protein
MFRFGMIALRRADRGRAIPVYQKRALRRRLDSGFRHLRAGELTILKNYSVTIALHPISKSNLEIRAKDLEE